MRAIKVYRLKAGITQTELGRRSGIDRALISHYERGVHAPSADTLRRLGDALGVPVWQFYWTEDLLDTRRAVEQTVQEHALAGA